MAEAERVRLKKGYSQLFIAGCKYRSGRGLIWSGREGNEKWSLQDGVVGENFFRFFLTSVKFSENIT